jgi:hypothetical protein
MYSVAVTTKANLHLQTQHALILGFNRALDRHRFGGLIRGALFCRRL